MKSIAIIWNAAYQYKKEITEMINSNENIKILKLIDIDLGDFYGSFVKKVYDSDIVALPTIENKIQSMLKNTNERKVRIIILNVSKLEQKYVIEKNIFVNVVIDEIKRKIRSDYKTKINYYFFDNIFHMTDNSLEYYELYKKIEKIINSNCF